MAILLDLLYLLLLLALAPWILVTALRTGKYREGFAEKFLGRVRVSPPTGTRVWLHAVSVGEVNLLRTLVERIAAAHPDWECVISTTTKTGYDLARKRYPSLTVFYAPLDFSWAVRAAMRRVRPDLLILAELELWPNLIRAARRHGVKLAIINGRLSDGSFRGYRRIRPVAASMLRSIDLIAVQNEEYASRFRQLGAPPERLHVTGSLKFDGAETDRNNPATCRLRELAGFHPSDIVFLAGSTQEPEESLALKTFRALKDEHSRLRLVLVPRHPERFDEVALLLARSGLPFTRRSKLPSPGQPHDARILLIDAVGELGAWWGAANIGFVGGSLSSRGGQNMIEPAAYGAAVSFGPNTRNFRDIVAQLLAANAAVVVHDGQELTAFVGRCLTDSTFAATLGRNAQSLVKSQLGATIHTLALVDTLLPSSPPAKHQSPPTPKLISRAGFFAKRDV